MDEGEGGRNVEASRGIKKRREKIGIGMKGSREGIKGGGEEGKEGDRRGRRERGERGREEGVVLEPFEGTQHVELTVICDAIKQNESELANITLQI